MFTVNRTALVNELALLVQVGEKKTTMPVLATVMLDVADKLTLYATNLDASVVSTIDVSGEPWTGCLPMAELNKFVRLAESDELSFQVKDTRMLIKAGKAKVQLPFVERGQFPALPVVSEGGTLTLPGEVLRTMLTRLLPCTTVEPSRHALKGVKFEAKDGTLKMAATDQHRLGVATLPVDGEINTLVPADGLAPLLKTSADVIVMSANENQASFQCGHQLIITRLLDGKFPHWEMIWPKGLPYTCDVATEAVTAAFKRVEITRNTMRDSAVRLTFERGTIGIDSGATDRGQCDEQVDVTGNLNGESILIGVNPDYVMDFLRNAGGRVRCELRDGATPVKLSDGSAFEYVVMPMRLD